MGYQCIELISLKNSEANLVPSSFVIGSRLFSDGCQNGLSDVGAINTTSNEETSRSS